MPLKEEQLVLRLRTKRLEWIELVDVLDREFKASVPLQAAAAKDALSACIKDVGAILNDYDPNP